ncbi:diaminopimelate epimerase [Spirochaetia bacterium]|nr:diaminopimelate epimerase [Spirochaetia bacterium]
MTYEIVVADPAKNITVLVLSPVSAPVERAAIAKALLADPGLGAEQVGFVISPPYEQPSGLRRVAPLWRAAPLWRLEMMGGEFCGNAARSFGLYIARRQGLRGQVRVDIEISGMKGSVPVQVDVEAGLAEAVMPLPIARETLSYTGADLPVYVFEGITQVIAPDIRPSESVFYAIKELLNAKQDADHPIDALGVMFWDTAAGIMTPAVYVQATDSLVFESSCGSGSAAMGIWAARNLPDGEERLSLSQPGGVIAVRIQKRGGNVTGVSIGGPVKLYPQKRYEVFL